MDVKNIIVIILDTLRKDYGEKYIGPILKKYGFVYYPNAIAPSSWTIPSHVSLFTGQYPSVHGVHENPKLKIPNIKVNKYLSKSFLPRIFNKNGYRTFLVSANELVQPDFGFIGFDENYDIFWAPKRVLSPEERDRLERYLSTKIKYIITPANLLIHGEIRLFWKLLNELIYQRKILALLKRYPLDKGVSSAISILKSLNLVEKNFIFINLVEVHEPYSTRYCSLGGINSTLTGQVHGALIKDWQRGYPREAKYLADKLEVLLNILHKKRLLENSLLIITSDHGQLLGEDNRLGHGVFLDDELIRIPLWIRLPSKDITNQNNIKNTSFGYISLVDLYSTLIRLIENGSLDIPTKNVVFSESHGIPTNIPLEKVPRKMHSWIHQLEKHRIAIYYDHYRAIYNVDDDVFEFIQSYDVNAKVTEDIREIFKDMVKKFLRDAKLRSAVRNIKAKKNLL